MSWPSVIAARLRGLLLRGRLERELEDEVRFHLEMQIEDNRKAGMSPAGARYAALRSFGAIAPMKETHRERRAFAFIETVAQDIRYALRTLRKNPAFTIAAVATLAIAIGGNTAMFSVLNAVILQPLPFREPGQLVMLWTEIPGQAAREGRSAYRNIEQWRAQSSSFADIAVADPLSLTLTSPAAAEQISAVRISPNYFSLLGLQPALGRAFSEEEASRRERVALISHRFWQSRFAGSPEAIGASIELDGKPSRIIGILPAKYHFEPFTTDVWEPHTLFPDWEARQGVNGAETWFALGRLKPGVSIEQAQTEMTALARRLDEQAPPSARNRGISLMPLALHVTGPASRTALWMLAGAVFCVLLIAAANVASLSLARSVARGREMAIRVAIGASRTRIARQLLVESLTLGTIAGLLGLAVADAVIRVILALQPAGLVRLNDAALNPQALAWTFVLCLLTGVLVGLAPAITTSPRNPGMRAAGRIRRVLVVAEFAMAIVLLAGAGLFIRSLRAIHNVDPGFRPEHVLSVQLSAPSPRPELFNRILEQIAALPGVESAGIIGDLFIGGNPERVITTEGAATPHSGRLRFRADEISPGFFQTIGTPLRSGRFFNAGDNAAAPRVAIVNEAMARRLWPGLEAIGKRFKPGGEDSSAPWFTVVGVVGDMRRQNLENEPIPQMFEPLAQNPSRLVTLLVRTVLDNPAQMAGAIQSAVHDVEPRTPVYRITALENRVDAGLSQRRFQAALLIGFSAVALLLAAIGIYGLIQYSIVARTRELGIRLAVGAQAGEIFRLIIREGLLLSLTGLGIGLIGAIGATRLAAGLLYGVTSTDPLTFITVSLLLTAVAIAACYVPARRAMRLDPLVALRHE
ncbi:MAG: ABC transporter permease [Acidobacteria bacterium]|nr:ABC transporter permease [Acidobacteriota bacterium]